MHRFRGDRLPEWKVGVLELGKQFAQGPGIDHRAGEVVLPQAAGFLEHRDVEVGHPATSGLVTLDEVGKFDGPCQSRRSGAHEQHVHLDGLGARSLSQDQALDRQLPLVPLGKDGRHAKAPGVTECGRRAVSIYIPRVPSPSERRPPLCPSAPPPPYIPRMNPHSIPGFRQVPFTGVIYVMAEASRLGYRHLHPDWCNLGQGQPETGPLPGAPPRITEAGIDPDDQEYAPVPGIWELREAVARLYNELYRQGMASQYTAANVCICGGGRASLTRAAAALGPINLGHFLPDYTAYEELLDIFKLFTAIPILLEGERGYAFGVDDLRREIPGRGLSALLLSNPCNPTGKVLQEGRLAEWVSVARELDCTLLLDEFYSHYVWTGAGRERGETPPRSTSRTSTAIRWCSSTASPRTGATRAGGPPGPWAPRRDRRRRQRRLLPRRRRQQAAAARGAPAPGTGARAGRDRSHPAGLSPQARHPVRGAAQGRGPLRRRAGGHVLLLGRRLRAAGGLNDGMAFFRAALEEKVICVPGEFFDVNPGKRRSGRPSRFRDYVRFSFGPEEAMVAEGVRRIARMVSGER